jgi:hypothetical protein
LCNELKIDNIDKILNIFHKYWSDKQLLNIEFNKNKFIKIWSEVLDIK